MPSKFKPTREHKRKVLARKQNGPAATASTDSNVEVVVPASRSEREERREALRAELRAQQSKPSAQKQKRLDKYIDKKLKKEESLHLLKLLAAEKEKHNTAGLQSSKHLSSKKRSFSDYVSGQVHPQSQATVVAGSGRSEGRQSDVIATQLEDFESEDSFEEDHPEAFEGQDGVAANDAWVKSRFTPTQGTGLAQPLQIGTDGLPIVPARGGKRRKDNEQSAQIDNVAIVQEEDDEDHVAPWEGFSETEESTQDSDESEQEDDTTDVDARLKNIDSKVLDALLQELERSDDSGSDEESDEQDLEEESSGSEDNSSDSSDNDGDSGSDETLTKSSDSESTSQTGTEVARIKPRVSAFKSWATQQLNTSLGHTPSYDQPQAKTPEGTRVGVKPAAGFTIGVKNLEVPATTRRAYSILIQRPEAITQSRSELPILQKEQEIMEAIYNNSVVVVKGDTGSGKTTQLPQFLFEAGFGDKDGPTPGLIGITQPRRVAAVSMAKRVGEELGSHGDKVAHQIRFDTTVSSNTAIKFMTDGILLRELSQDLLLKKYSAIVIDEAHERSVNTDLLIGMLSRIVPARMKKTEQNPDPKPLKLIIMSATLNINDFLHEKLFSSGMRPPIVEAEGRQHRVTTHFALRSRADYIEEIIEKVKRAHRKLPRGGVLVFLTGQNEIKHVLSRLKDGLTRSATSIDTMPRMHISGTETPLEKDDIEFGEATSHLDPTGETDDDIDILVDEEEADKEFEISDDEEADHTPSTEQKATNKDPYDKVHLLPLYSQLPTKDQLRIFESPPDRARLIVLATNVAETSLTIPGIKYVFDCGRSKERKYNTETNVQSFEIDYISKASAQQRAGRAGRTGPGHCWRLYSSAVFEQFFPDHTEPEILHTPAESIVLQLKDFRYPRPIAEFPFPSPPSTSILNKAEKLLRHIGAIAGGSLTDLGRKLSAYPLSPRLAKIVVKAVERPKILLEVLIIVAALSVDDIFINATLIDKAENNEDQDTQKQAYGRAHAAFSKNDTSSDVLKTLTAVQLYIAAPDKEVFCQNNFVRQKALAEITQLYAQLRSIVQANNPSLILKDKQLQPKLNTNLVKDINNTVASGFVDQIALRYDLHPTPPVLPRQPTRSIDTPYLPLTPVNPKSPELVDKAVFIHPSSLLSRLSPKALPPYIIYRHLQTSQAHTVSASSSHSLHKPKTRMLPLTPIDAPSLLSLIRDTGLIEYGKPVPQTKVEDVPGTRPKERICWVSTSVKSDGAGAGSFGWPLPPCKVRQVMDLKDKSGSGWRVVQVIA